MKKTIIFLSIALLFSACSIFKQTKAYEEVDDTAQSNQSEEVYVFDDNNNNDDVDSTEIKTINKEIDNALTQNQVNEADNTTNNIESKTETETTATVTENVVTTETQPVENETSYVQTDYGNEQTQIFYVQLGAFSSLTRAENFSSAIESEVPFNISVIYNNSKGLYIVRSSPYTTREEAESVRDNLKQNFKFKDCFIITEYN